MGNAPGAHLHHVREFPVPQITAPGGDALMHDAAPPSEDTYIGALDEDARKHGVGTLLYANHDAGERARYYGDWVHGIRHGHGSLLWRNGSKYDGGFSDDKLCGFGVMHWSLGLIYRGEWQNNVAHGRGELCFPSGKRYFGDWAAGKRHGWGRLTFEANDEKQRIEYAGNWIEDVQSGHGIMTWSNNAKYEGNWSNGKRHGFGVHQFPNGERYEGEWKDGVREGFGRRFNSDGTIYEGGWFKDKKHGNGKLHLPHGRIVYQRWEHGVQMRGPHVLQDPQSLLTLCMEAVVFEPRLAASVAFLPREVQDKIAALRLLLPKLREHFPPHLHVLGQQQAALQAFLNT